MRQRLPLILSIAAVPLAVAALVIALLSWAGITPFQHGNETLVALEDNRRLELKSLIEMNQVKGDVKGLEAYNDVVDGDIWELENKLLDIEAELAEDAAASEAATKKKNKKVKKKNKKAKKKQRRVAVALGEPNEFDLIPAKAKVKAGEVTFKLKNTGSIEHELIVIRTDLDSGELPTDGNGAAAEHGAVAPHGKGHGDGAEHAGAHVGTHVAAGEAGSVTLKLEPGSYALVCNLPGHYASGMHSNFTVTA